MKISQTGLNLIKQFEGCRLTAYQDSVKVWTIGWGTTNADKSITGTTIKSGLKITQATADNWLEQSVNTKYAPKVDKYNNIYHFNQNQFDALVSFCYNIGSIDQLTKNGTRSIAEISEYIPAYNKAGGKVLAGLVKRRNAEKALFDTAAAPVVPESSPAQESQPVPAVPYFDVNLYNGLYSDLQAAFNENAKALLSHYINYGIKEGRIASYNFDPIFYHNQYGDLAEAFKGDAAALYNHYITWGIKEGRQASILFDPQYYLAKYTDLQAAFGNDYQKALEHFLTFGITEGRIASSQFNVQQYKAKNDDLNAAFGDDWKAYFCHYLSYGRNENRICY